MGTKSEQIAAIRADQRFWRDLAAEVGSDRYAEPGPMGDWSFGDMAGHLAGMAQSLDHAHRGSGPRRARARPAVAVVGGRRDGRRRNDQRVDARATCGPLARGAGGGVRRLVRSARRRHRGDCPTRPASDPDAFPWIGGPLVDADFTDHLHEEHVPKRPRVARPMSEEGWRGFLAADGVEDWVVLHGGATAAFRVASIAATATALAQAIAGVPGCRGPGAAARRSPAPG